MIDETTTRIGFITPTSPASSALDTLKALTMRNIDHLEYVLDRLSDPDCGVAEDVLEFIDAVKLAQYKALAEHVPVATDELLGELRHVHPDGYRYDDGTPVLERFESRFGTSVHFTRYDGDRAEALQRHQDWVQQVERDVNAELPTGEIIDGINWGRRGPDMDA